MRFVSAIVLAALPASALAADPEVNALYPTGTVRFFFNNEAWRAEVKVTKQQQKALEETKDKRAKVADKFNTDWHSVVNSKLPSPQKNAKLRALDTSASDALFRLYGKILQPQQIKRMKQILFQELHMEVFDHPEVRQALKITEKQARALHEIHYKLLKEASDKLKADLQAKKITPEVAARKAQEVAWSVPDQVRAQLSQEQQKVFADLFGKKLGSRK